MKKALAIALAAVMLIGISAAPVKVSAAEGTDLKIGVILVGDETEGYTAAHMEGIKTAAEELGFRQVRALPKGKVPYLLDNVVDTGATAKAAFKALGCGIILSYAMSDTLLKTDSNRRMLIR